MSQEQKDPYEKYREIKGVVGALIFSAVLAVFGIAGFLSNSAEQVDKIFCGMGAGIGGIMFLVVMATSYRKRNLTGYNLCYFRRGDRTETEVVYRPAMNVFLERKEGLVLTVPLGGWFNWPKAYFNGVKHIWQVSWKERHSGAIGLSNDRSTLWILSFRGEKYGPFQVNEAFNEICEMDRLGSQVGLRGYLMAACGASASQSVKGLEQFRSSLETTENTNAELIHLLCGAAERLDQTQRLKYSREGKPFTLWLITALCEFLAKDGNEGREKYEAMLEGLQANKAKPPEPPPEAPTVVPVATPTSPTA